MELRLKPYHKNLFPQGAVLIQGEAVKAWLKEIQAMKLSLSAVTVYPLPGLAANSVWGCLVVGNFERTPVDAGRNTFCQSVYNRLFIPERSIIYPKLSAEEVAKLFASNLYFLHPEIGLVELEEAIDWTTIVQLPQILSPSVSKPLATPFVPTQIKTFRVKALPPEEELKSFEAANFPTGQKFSDKPLDPLEKAKLFFYRTLFKNFGKEAGAVGGGKTESGSLISRLEGLRKLFSKKESNWTQKLQQDFAQLEKRNQKHLDRLLELLKENPAEALKYALPLDNEGTGRGGLTGAFNLDKRWGSFSLFGNDGNSRGSGTSLLSGDSYRRLSEQYRQTALELIKQKDYRKAAFVYLKLLKDHLRAAQTLEEGNLYGEAAAVYLKYVNNKSKAADCFEKGAMYDSAIELYKELNNDEKVGDLYVFLDRKKEGFSYYQKVVDNYTTNHQYLKAGLLCKNKMQNEAQAQATLLKGWRLNRDAFNCLNNYFANIRDTGQLAEQLQLIYDQEVTTANSENFLRVLQHEYGKHEKLKQTIRDMAYEIVVDKAKTDPSILSELRTFNKDDKLLLKDVMRFKLNTGK